MDTIKTGALIRELRKEHNMTQKDLADQLHITDRAVSKWERGLCAPDIATLEPLAAILQVTVTELIAGERMPEKEHIMEIEKNVQDTIDYSEHEISNNKKQHRTKLILTICICVILCAGLSFFLLWKSGYFFLIDQSISPDQTREITVYNRPFHPEMKFTGWNDGPYTTIIVDNVPIIYQGSYQNIYWSPDSLKYIFEIENEGRKELELYAPNLDSRLGHRELCFHLALYFHLHDWSELGYTIDNFVDGIKEATYDFIQWGDDSRSILLSYSYHDAHGTHYQGCIWYDYVSDTILDSLDLPPQNLQIS